MKRIITGKTPEQGILAATPHVVHERVLDDYTLGYMAAMTDVLAMLHERIDHGPAGESGAIRETRDYIIAHVASLQREPDEKVVPVDIDFHPANPSCPDNSVAGSKVCTFVVRMSDGSVYRGTNVTPSAVGMFSVTSAGDGQLTFSRALTMADDGAVNVEVTATQDGSSITRSAVLSIVPVL